MDPDRFSDRDVDARDPEIVVIPDFPAELGERFATDVAPFVGLAAALAPASTPVVAPTPAAVPGPTPEPIRVVDPALPAEPSGFEFSDRGRRTGSDYVMLGVTGLAISLGVAVLGLVGYVAYSLFAAVFGALSGAAVAAAGGLPLLLVCGVAFFVLGGRGRGGGAVAGASSGVATAVAAPVLVGMGVVRAVASMPGLPGAQRRRAARSVGAVPGSRGSRFVAGSAPGGSFSGQSVPADFTGTTVSGPVARMSGRGPRVVDSSLGYARAAAPVGQRQSLVSRLVRGKSVAAPAMVEVKASRVSRLLGGPATVMVAAAAGSASSGVSVAAPSGRVSTLLFGSDSPTAYFANPGADLGIVGKLRRRSLRAAPLDDPRFERVTDVPIEWIVDGLTERWVDRMRTASPEEGVTCTFRAKGGPFSDWRYCAVGFLLQECDPNGWYNAGTWAQPRWRHRNLESLYPRYGRNFLWHISNMFDAQQWNLKDCAAFVEREMGLVK